VNCSFYRRQSSCLDALAMLDQSGEVRVVSADSWNGDDVRLYQLRPPP
jgi:hypothetical protein